MSPKTRGDKQLMYWTGCIILAIFIECNIAYAISVLRKIIRSRTRRERVVEMLVNQENRVFRKRNISEDSEISTRTEGTSSESEPVFVGGPLVAAYDQKRLDAIRDTIREAREKMGIRYPENHPNVPDSVEHY